MQLIVHTPDGGQEFRPAYSVTVAGGRVFVYPLREGWGVISGRGRQTRQRAAERRKSDPSSPDASPIGFKGEA